MDIPRLSHCLRHSGFSFPVQERLSNERALWWQETDIPPAVSLLRLSRFRFSVRGEPLSNQRALRRWRDGHPGCLIASGFPLLSHCSGSALSNVSPLKLAVSPSSPSRAQAFRVRGPGRGSHWVLAQGPPPTVTVHPARPPTITAHPARPPTVTARLPARVSRGFQEGVLQAFGRASGTI